jgi:hypothetical protein
MRPNAPKPTRHNIRFIFACQEESVGEETLLSSGHSKTSVTAARLRGPWLSGELANQANVPVVLKTVQRAVKDVG